MTQEIAPWQYFTNDKFPHITENSSHPQRNRPVRVFAMTVVKIQLLPTQTSASIYWIAALIVVLGMFTGDERCQAANPKRPPIAVFFGPRAADDPEGIYANLQQFLNSANRTLYGSCHEIDMIAVAKTLAERSRQGVEVHLILESDWWSGQKSLAARQVLEASKVRITLDTKKGGLLHNKFFIADQRRVWTGSANLTETCLLYNANATVWIEHPRVAESYYQEFAEQRRKRFGKRDGGVSTTPVVPVELPGGTKVAAYFGPDDEPIKPIVKMIDRANSTVDIACFVFSSPEIGQACKAAHRRGVTVRVLVDNLYASDAATKRWTYVPFRDLSKAGITFRYDNEKSKFHHKMVIVDRQLVMIGSMNLSTTGANENDENLVIIQDKNLGEKCGREFENLWQMYDGKPGEIPPLEAGDDEN